MPNTEDMLIDRMVGAEWSPAASPAMKRVGGLGSKDMHRASAWVRDERCPRSCFPSKSQPSRTSTCTLVGE